MKKWQSGVAALAVSLLASISTARAGGAVVGTGTPASCTEQALDKALASRGPVTFNCGTQPSTIVVTTTKTISADLAIDGGKLVTLSGNKATRVFWVNSGITFDLKNLAIADGYPSKPPQPTTTRTATPTPRGTQKPTKSPTSRPTRTPSPTQPANQGLTYLYAMGGGIYNNGGTVKISNVSLIGNHAADLGGAIFNLAGTINITGSAITDNQLEQYNSLSDFKDRMVGSGIANYGGTVTIDNTTILGNTGGNAAIYNGNKGSLTITNSTITENRGELGGGILNSGGTLILTGSTVSNNQSRTGGGVVHLDGTSTLTAVTFTGNKAQSAAALYISKGTATIANSIFTKNDNSRGAVYVQQGADVTVTGTTFTANSSEYTSGIYNSGGDLTIIGSTFTDGAGAAISSSGTLGMFNSTVTRHRGSYSGDDAVQIYGGTATIVNTTIARNDMNGITNVLFGRPGGETTLRNTLVAYNGRNCAGTIIDGGNNLQFPETWCGKSVRSADPLLDTGLGNNGGSTQTLALLPKSPAIDAGNPSVCFSLPINNLDQRGYVRPVDGNGDGKAVCDIGAFEFNAKPSKASAAATTSPLPPACPDVNGTTNDVVRAVIPDGAVDGGKIYCRVITTSAEIGVQSVIDRGVVRAAEVLALTDDGTTLIPKFKKGVKVCLQGNGILLQLEANTTPRAPVQVTAAAENSYTCGTVKSAGTLVLVLR